MSVRECPVWVREEPFIQHILKLLLRKAETGHQPRVRISEKIAWCAPLFDYNHNQGPRLFGLLQLLAERDFDLLLISPSSRRKKQFETEYEGAYVELKRPAMPLLRKWLELPAYDEYPLSMQDAVYRQRTTFADQGASLLAAMRHLKVPGQSADDVIAAFTRIPVRAEYCLSLRELSASCFWGDSKYLDSRQDLLIKLFPQIMQSLARRARLLQVKLPAQIDGVLIIENQDTFVRACLGRLSAADNLAIVYGSGFRATADGIRQRGSVIFAGVENPRADVAAISALRKQFENDWFCHEDHWPVYFFGDLDYAGMAILAGLRRQFGSAQAWQPGYDFLVQQLRAGGGHSADQSGKTQQKTVLATGCPYADSVLIPALQQTNRFMDQEFQPA